MGLAEANVILPSGARASLHFDSSGNPLPIHLPKSVDECTLNDVKERIVQHQDSILARILEAAKASEHYEIRAADVWKITNIVVGADMDQIRQSAKKGSVVPFTVTG